MFNLRIMIILKNLFLLNLYETLKITMDDLEGLADLL